VPAESRKPRDEESLAARAETLIDSGRPRPALAFADRAVSLAPQGWRGLAARARARRALGDARGALADLDAALARRPAWAAAQEARGVLLAEMGRLAEARAAYLAALGCDPAWTRAHFGLAWLGKVDAAHLAAMEALAAVAAPLDAGRRLFLLYALAKGYDDAGDCVRALASSEVGARLRASPSPEAAERNLRRLARAGPEAAGETGRGDPTEAPIFVFGMPRSGTTLVEQILASHPHVCALGETEVFGRLADRIREPSELAAAYLAAWPPEARGARRVVDKSLGNFLRLTAIRRAFPNARLVHVRRDPLDCCLSIHFSLFAGETPFPGDLAGIGRYWRGYAALMADWRAALPGEVLHEVVYERLVAEPEREPRALLAFCELPFDARCLAFHETRRPITTASLAQVRRPIYAHSVGRARRYAPFLGRLAEALQGSSS
jgi:tetratricopeptide (TPR) repeat protein